MNMKKEKKPKEPNYSYIQGCYTNTFYYFYKHIFITTNTLEYLNHVNNNYVLINNTWVDVENKK